MHLSVLNDSGLDLADDIDVAEATTLISFRPRTGTPSHPAVGMKRPRSRPTIPTANKCPRRKPELDCSQCHHLLAENRELKEANALLTEQLTLYRMESTNTIKQSEAPRPGKVPKAIAEKYHVRVFLFIHTCVIWQKLWVVQTEVKSSLFVLKLVASFRGNDIINSIYMQGTKKFRSDSPGLVNFVVWLVEFILHLPDGQVKVFWEFIFLKLINRSTANHRKFLG